MKNNKKLILRIILACGLITLGAFVGHIITLQEYSCSGIGGFVYQEIEWAEQTYNIVNDCRDLDNMNVPVLYYNDDKRQFYCIETNNCDEDGCKYKERYLDPIIQK